MCRQQRQRNESHHRPLKSPSRRTFSNGMIMGQACQIAGDVVQPVPRGPRHWMARLRAARLRENERSRKPELFDHARTSRPHGCSPTDAAYGIEQCWWPTSTVGFTSKRLLRVSATLPGRACCHPGSGGPLPRLGNFSGCRSAYHDYSWRGLRAPTARATRTRPHRWPRLAG
jgi:hypothetical protein